MSESQAMRWLPVLAPRRRFAAAFHSWVCCALLAWALPVRADETSLSWVRLDGAEECIAAPQLAKLVESRIGRPVLQSPSRAERSIEARVAPQPDGGWLAIISVNDRVGRRLGQRELRVASGPCSQLDRPASLAISLIIDPNAAGPGLIERGALSDDAQRLLAQIELPSGDPDALLASLDFTPKPSPPNVAPRTTANTAATKPAPATPPARMVTVSEAEWHDLQDRARAQDSSDRLRAPMPIWPGYVLLGVGAAAAVTAAIAFTVGQSGTDTSDFRKYRDAVAVSNAAGATAPVTNICTVARKGLAYDLDASVPKNVASTCDEHDVMTVLFWVFASTAVATSAVGAAWLLWIADDPAAKPDRSRSATFSLTPIAGTSFTGLQLRLRM